jgi:hypothetical protein
MEGNCRSLIKMLSQYLSGGTKENSGNPAQTVGLVAEIQARDVPNPMYESYSNTLSNERK